jgi:hypothetical protein
MGWDPLYSRGRRRLTVAVVQQTCVGQYFKPQLRGVCAGGELLIPRSTTHFDARKNDVIVAPASADHDFDG